VLFTGVSRAVSSFVPEFSLENEGYKGDLFWWGICATPVGNVHAIVVAVANPLPGYCYIRAGDLYGLPWELYVLSLRLLPIHSRPVSQLLNSAQ
jgi:hypothetical protein